MTLYEHSAQLGKPGNGTVASKHLQFPVYCTYEHRTHLEKPANGLRRRYYREMLRFEDKKAARIDDRAGGMPT